MVRYRSTGQARVLVGGGAPPLGDDVDFTLPATQKATSSPAAK
jgi:hypothetical protein